MGQTSLFLECAVSATSAIPPLGVFLSKIPELLIFTLFSIFLPVGGMAEVAENPLRALGQSGWRLDDVTWLVCLNSLLGMPKQPVKYFKTAYIDEVCRLLSRI